MLLHDDHDQLPERLDHLFCRPISGVIMALTVIALVLPLLKDIVKSVTRSRRREPFFSRVLQGQRCICGCIYRLTRTLQNRAVVSWR